MFVVSSAPLASPCPFGMAEYAECSRHGRCERGTGRCECSFGFRGDACDDTSDSDDAQVYTVVLYSSVFPLQVNYCTVEKVVSGCRNIEKT